MQTMNTHTLVHIGVELVIIGGLTFWFQRKTSLLQNEIDQLRDKVSKYEGVIESQGQLLMRHSQILRSLFGGELPSRGFGPPRHSRNHPGNLNPLSQRQNISPLGISPVDLCPQRPRGRSKEDTEPDLLPEELDKLLQEELGNIQQSRSLKSSQPEFIEVDCRGDAYELKAPYREINQRLKKRNRRRGKDGKTRK